MVEPLQCYVTYKGNFPFDVSNGIKANDNLTVISRNVNQRISIAGNKSNEILVHQNTRAVSKGANDALKTASDEAKNLGISGIMAKTWRNMADERVRPNQRYRTKKGWKTTRVKNPNVNHIKMEGQTVGIDEEFDLGHGIKALLPRESGDPSNDINCRCYVEYNFMTAEEFAKKTGRSIDEVKKSFGNAEKTEKTVDTEAKIKYNKDNNRNEADREQYNTYKEVLGKNAPESFEEFQNLKYGDAETWDLFKSYKRAIDSGELTPLADFELYQKTDEEIKDKIVGKKP